MAREITGRLFDRLQEIFPREQRFIDVDSILPGLDFVQVLQEQVAKCDILLAVIGKNWITARDEAGDLRLHSPKDFVRIEIASALEQNKRVIPVLVGDARMPREEDLPDVIRPLARRNAVRLTHERFRADTRGLAKAIEQILNEAEAIRRAIVEAQRSEIEEARRREARRREEASAAERATVERDANEDAQPEGQERPSAEAAADVHHDPQTPLGDRARPRLTVTAGIGVLSCFVGLLVAAIWYVLPVRSVLAIDT
jgi:hypothetical protein